LDLKFACSSFTPAHAFSLYAIRSTYDCSSISRHPSQSQKLQRWLYTIALYPLRVYPLIQIATSPLLHPFFPHRSLTHVNVPIIFVFFSFSRCAFVLELNHVEVMAGATASAMRWCSSGNVKEVLVSFCSLATRARPMLGRAVVVLAPDIVRACKESSSGMKSEPNVGFACELVSVAVWPLRWPLCVAEETLGGAENGKETC
jgi:hypothetical protein